MTVICIHTLLPASTVVANMVGSTVDIDGTGSQTDAAKTEAAHFTVAVPLASFLGTDPGSTGF